MDQLVKDQCCHCCGASFIPGSGTLAGHSYSSPPPKKKKKKKKLWGVRDRLKGPVLFVFKPLLVFFQDNVEENNDS